MLKGNRGIRAVEQKDIYPPNRIVLCYRRSSCGQVRCVSCDTIIIEVKRILWQRVFTLGDIRCWTILSVSNWCYFISWFLGQIPVWLSHAVTQKIVSSTVTFPTLSCKHSLVYCIIMFVVVEIAKILFIRRKGEKICLVCSNRGLPNLTPREQPQKERSTTITSFKILYWWLQKSTI